MRYELYIDYLWSDDTTCYRTETYDTEMRASHRQREIVEHGLSIADAVDKSFTIIPAHRVLAVKRREVAG